jgi:type I restriction enzyme S subunit
MSFSRYPAYKDSGVEWLGEVPEHWHVSKLKHSCRLLSGGTPSKANPNYWDGSIPWASSKDLKTEVLAETIDHVTELAVADGAPLVEPGDLLVVVRGMILAHSFPVAKVATRMSFNQDLKALRVGPGWDVDYFAGALRAAKTETFRRLDEAGHGTKALRMEAWTGMGLAKPPIHEQRTIAAFLDRETARIDALVGEQERLIELLKEKRQAVISHAVTKGLNPKAAMKDSGVEWLGEVPAHWEVGPFKRFWSVTDCKHVTAEFVDGGIPLASIREVQGRWIALEDAKATTEHFYKLLIEGGRQPLPGDLIFSRNATVGEVAQVPANHPRFAMGQDVVLLRRLCTESCPDFMHAVLRSPVVAAQLAVLMIGSTFKRINVEEIRNLIVPWPPPNEQFGITQSLEPALARLDLLLTEAQRAIDLLQERRTALITAAVTGQIDVREVEA